jgi:hypothetical protein
MPTEELVQEILAVKVKEVQARLKKEGKAGGKCVDPKDKTKFCTPLHHAVASASLEIVNALLGVKADVAGVDQDGAEPLHWAARSAEATAVAIAGTWGLIVTHMRDGSMHMQQKR